MIDWSISVGGSTLPGLVWASHAIVRLRAVVLSSSGIGILPLVNWYACRVMFLLFFTKLLNQRNPSLMSLFKGISG